MSSTKGFDGITPRKALVRVPLKLTVLFVFDKRRDRFLPLTFKPLLIKDLKVSVCDTYVCFSEYLRWTFVYSRRIWC